MPKDNFTITIAAIPLYFLQRMYSHVLVGMPHRQSVHEYVGAQYSTAVAVYGLT